MRLSLLSALCVAKKKAVNDHRPVDRLRYKESTEAFFLQIKNNNKILIKILGFNHSIFRIEVKKEKICYFKRNNSTHDSHQ